jgi:ATP-dependent Clp protease ATP-binding subunit ClpA
VVGAQEQARAAGSDTITVAHLVLALLADPDGTAARVLAAQGVPPADVRRTASATLPAAAATVPDMIPFDPHARAALERTFAEASRLGAEQVGVEHLLLAVLAVEDGTGVLAGHGVTAESVEAHLSGA